MATVMFTVCFTASVNNQQVQQNKKWSQQMVESHGLKSFYTNKTFHENLANSHGIM